MKKVELYICVAYGGHRKTWIQKMGTTVIYIHGGFSKSTYVELLIAESQLI
jgi:hypothetical protein